VSAALAVLASSTAGAAAASSTTLHLQPARTYPERRDEVKLLVVDPRRGRLRATRMDELPSLLAPGDLLVMNDAATLPASLLGRDQQHRPLEARLCGQPAEDRFQAVLLGAGDWQLRTEDRPPPPPVAPGSRLSFGPLTATVLSVSPLSARLVELRFDQRGDQLWSALYRHGRPVQYAHLAHPLPLWAVQNVYAARPVAFEMPSAGRPLSWRILLAARARGVKLATVSHAAGLSATGDATLDAALPLPERFEIPAATVAAVAQARGRGGRVVAVGTTVVRALEGAHRLWGGLRAGSGITDLRLDGTYRLQVTSGLLSGMHEPRESHFALLGAFAGRGLLRRAHQLAAQQGFRSHELGDAQLIL
jgi:S-adenosylmethionine:tRNA ribosyltransferase-isomerase